MNKSILITLMVVFLVTLTPIFAITDENDVEQAFKENELVNVIVTFDDTTSPNKLKENVETKNVILKSKIKSKTSNFEEINKAEINIKREYQSFEGFSGKINKQAFEELRNMSGVKEIHLDIIVHKSLDSSVPSMDGDNTWDIQLENQNITGNGQTICIIDTGIDTDHPDFTGRVLAQYCYCDITDAGSGGCCPDTTNEDNNAEDDDDHGTHVAGIAAGNGSQYKGIAPGAGIVSIKALNSNGDGLMSDVASGIDWCVNNRATYNITTISMSLGTSNNFNDTNFCDTGSIKQPIWDAVANGITVVVASGNEGNETGVGYPACVTNATSVGSTNDAGTISSFSNIHSIVDLLAAGELIMSSDIGGGYQSKQGTSMATPHVAGAIALLRQFIKLQNGTDLTVSEVKNTLVNTGDNSTGWPRINIFDAIKSLDLVAPTIELISPENNTGSRENTSTLTYNTTESGTCNLYLNISGIQEINQTNHSVAYGQNNFQITLNEGHWNWSIECNDSNNNIANSTNGNILIIDQTYPTISFSTLTLDNYSNTSNSYIEFNVTYTETNFANITWNINGTTYTNTTQLYVWNETGLSDGNYSYNVTICDIANNCNSTQTRTIEIDITGPIFSHTLTNYILEYGTNFSYDINVTNGIANFSINDTTNFAINFSTGILTNNTILSVGMLTLNISVNDSLGNINEGIINVTVQDTVLPIFTQIPTNQIINTSDSFSYDINVTDNYALANFSINDTTNFAINFSTGILTNNTILSAIIYHINLSVNDSSGNINSSLIYLTANYIQTVNITANTSMELNLTQDVNLTLYVNENVNTTLLISTVTPNSTPSSLTSLKSVNISVDSNTKGNLSWAYIKIYYTTAELAAANIDESTLKIYYHNLSVVPSTWVLEPNQGVDTTNNFVWANVTHFSLYGSFGSAPVTPSSPSSGGGGGGGGSSSNEVSIGLTTIGTQYTDLKRNDIFKFTENNIVYSLKLTQVNTDKVDFLFAPTNEKFTLTTNQDKTIDLISDKKLSINLNNIVSRKATITLKKVIAKVLPVITFPAKKTETSEIEDIPVLNETIEEVLIEDTKKPFNILKWSIITITLIILITGFSYVTYEKYKNLKRIREML